MYICISVLLILTKQIASNVDKFTFRDPLYRAVEGVAIQAQKKPQKAVA